MNLPRTEIQQRLDSDFDALFAVALPPITPPLSPDDMAEGDECAERC
jgi:hypothetical protein